MAKDGSKTEYTCEVCGGIYGQEVHALCCADVDRELAAYRALGL